LVAISCQGQNQTAGLARETNWMGYQYGSIALRSILGKRTGWVKSMIRQDLILKILKSFIRCHQQIGVGRLGAGRLSRNDFGGNLESHLESVKEAVKSFPSINWTHATRLTAQGSRRRLARVRENLSPCLGAACE
jgi:hypothetical protein